MKVTRLGKFFRWFFESFISGIIGFSSTAPFVFAKAVWLSTPTLFFSSNHRFSPCHDAVVCCVGSECVFSPWWLPFRPFTHLVWRLGPATFLLHGEGVTSALREVVGLLPMNMLAVQPWERIQDSVWRHLKWDTARGPCWTRNTFFWANYCNSLTWIKGILRGFPN